MKALVYLLGARALDVARERDDIPPRIAEGLPGLVRPACSIAASPQAFADAVVEYLGWPPVKRRELARYQCLLKRRIVALETHDLRFKRETFVRHQFAGPPDRPSGW